MNNKIVKRYEDGEVRTLLGDRLHSFNGRASLVDPLNGLKTWHKNGMKHRDGDKPAVIQIRSGVRETIVERTWYSKSNKHREAGKPAYIRVQTNHNSDFEVTISREEHWYVNDVLGRDEDKPSIIKSERSYDAEGNLFHEINIKEYYKNNYKHRENNSPAIVKRVKDLEFNKLYTTRVLQEFYVEGQRHREGGKPAVKEIGYFFNEDGSKHVGFKYETYCVKDILHRLGNKPASLTTHYNLEGGSIYSHEEAYYVKGVATREGDKPAYYFIDNGPGLGKEIEAYIIQGAYHREGNLPAVTVKNNDEKTVYYSFYKNGVHIENDLSLKGTYLRELLLHQDPVFTFEECEAYPLSQINSLVTATSQLKYVEGVPTHNHTKIRRAGIIF